MCGSVWKVSTYRLYNNNKKISDQDLESIFLKVYYKKPNFLSCVTFTNIFKNVYAVTIF